MNCIVFLERMIIGFPGQLSPAERLKQLAEKAKAAHGERIEIANVDHHLYSIEGDVFLVLEYCNSTLLSYGEE